MNAPAEGSRGPVMVFSDSDNESGQQQQWRSYQRDQQRDQQQQRREEKHYINQHRDGFQDSESSTTSRSPHAHVGAAAAGPHQAAGE